MKILLISPYSGIQGGISRWTEHILNYYESLNSKSCNLQLLPVKRSKYISNTSLFIRLWYGIKDYSKIYHEFKKKTISYKYDIVHIASSASISLFKDLLIMKYARKQKIKTIIHFHFGRIPELEMRNNWEWKLILKVISIADKVIVIDKFSYETFNKYGYNNIIYLPNPVANRIIDIINKYPDITREAGKILFVGHVIKTKGIFELIEAFKNINNNNFTLRIVGYIEPHMKNVLNIHIGEIKNIEITGEEPYEEIIKDMLSCDIFVLPTYTEGFPNVILESMTCSCAIISTRVGAIPELLEKDQYGEYGILIDSQNVYQLQSAILKMINDTQLKKQCGDNCKKRVHERYSMPIIWKQLTNIWENCLK